MAIKALSIICTQKKTYYFTSTMFLTNKHTLIQLILQGSFEVLINRIIDANNSTIELPHEYAHMLTQRDQHCWWNTPED